MTKLALCIQANKIPHISPNRQYVTGLYANEIHAAVCYGKYAAYHDRQAAETDIRLRQVIPYIVVTNTISGEYLLLERKSSQTEGRLHGKKYIGVGGHVDVEEGIEESDAIRAAAERELKEETGLDHSVMNFVGVIALFTDQTVDLVHLGFVYHAFTSTQVLTSEELYKHDPIWVNKHEILDHYSSLEAWSQTVVNNYLF